MNILITSSSHKVPLVLAAKNAAKKISADIKVIAGDINTNSTSFYFSDSCWIMPETKKENIEEIIEGCKQRDITIILPTRDAELLFWSENKAIFLEFGISIIVSAAKSVKNCFDKLSFYRNLAHLGYPIIQTDLDIDNINSNRFVVKERFGSGSHKLGLNLDYEQAKQFANQLADPIFQPFIQGKEFSADIWVDMNCRVKGISLRYRELVVGGESKITTTFIDENIEKQLIDVVNALKLKGPVVVQGIIDESKKMYIIECNARFGGASTASISVGLDCFYWSFLEIQGENLADYEFVRDERQVKLVRASMDLFYTL